MPFVVDEEGARAQCSPGLSRRGRRGRNRGRRRGRRRLPQTGNIHGPSVAQRRCRAGIQRRRRHRGCPLHHPGADPLRARNPRRSRRLETRVAHRLRIHPGNRQRSRGARRLLPSSQIQGPRDHRIHGRRFWRQVRRGQSRSGGGHSLKEDRRSGSPHARSRRGASLRRQPAQFRSASPHRREKRRHHHRDSAHQLWHRRMRHRRRMRRAGIEPL